MKLRSYPSRPLTVAAAPLVDLALLLVLSVSVAAMFATVGGVGLHFAGTASAGSGEPGSGPALIVAVDADGGVRLDGAPVSREGLTRAVRDRLEKEPSATVLLVVDPSATYQEAIDAAAPLLEDASRRGAPVSIPTRRQIEALRADPGMAGRLP